MTRQFSLIFICILILCFLPSLTFANTKTVIDGDGRQLKIPINVQRVVVLTNVCIEAINYLGSINKIAGRIKLRDSSPLLEELIPAFRNIPVVSESESDVNIEKLLSVKPDVVIALGGEVGFRLKSSLVERIEAFGVPVVLIKVRSLEDNYETIRLMGMIFNNEKKAEDMVNHMKGIVNMVKQKTKKIPDEKRLRVLTVSGNDITTVIAGDWGKEDIRVLAGGKNVAGDIRQFVATVSLEQIIAWNPDVITISHLGRMKPKDIIENPRLQNINAVKNRRVYQNSYYIGGLYTPKVVLLLCWYAAKIYPELGIDWVKTADNFYRKIYGIPYPGLKN